MKKGPTGAATGREWSCGSFFHQPAIRRLPDGPSPTIKVEAL